jgi:hypothetical protein
MCSRTLVVHAAIIGFCSAISIAQQSHSASSSLPLREFPVVMQQSVEAGKTPVGTKLQARLAVATLFHGTVIPRNAIVSGVIFESVAKSAKAPSRLGIRMETARWKDQSTCMIKAYLMPLYYAMNQSIQSLPNESPDPDSRNLNGPAQSSSPMYQRPFPDNSEASRAAIPDAPTMSSRPVAMKNVALEPVSDGGIELVSEHANIKLYKMTTYVLAAIEPPAN